MLYESETRDITLALTGDVMLTRRLSVFKEERFLQLREILRGADVAFGNFESSARKYDEGTPGVGEGTFMTTDPALLDDLKWFGFNLFSCANNHATDFGEGGILATLRHLDEAGIVHAGTGRNLREARSPAYLDTRAGRVALIATNSFFKESHPAGDQRPDYQGRPGINPLGFETSYTIDSQAMQELRRMSNSLGFEALKERKKGDFYSAAELGIDSDKFSFLNQKFQAGSGFAVKTRAKERDVVENLRQIREARRQSNWVIVSMHYHEMGGPTLMTAQKRTEVEDCADFVKDFAHRCIDEGADIIVGHGPHIALGMEVYKGKPILYSLGNLVLQNETVNFFPAHAYSRFGLNDDATPADFLDVRSDNDRKSHPADPLFWETFCAVCKFTSGKLKQVQLYPVDLGFRRPRAERGRPLVADPEIGNKIIARAARLSKAYGTEVAYRDFCGIVE